jgi:carotenoid cleavage dioxygenase-like enzyme
MTSAVEVTGNRVLGFTTLDDEVRIGDLPVRGTLPSWLTGSLIRTTPALLDISGKGIGHWFDGRAMLNRFSFADGKVGYANRYLPTASYRAARAGWNDRLLTCSSDPCTHLGQRLTLFFDPSRFSEPNVNVVKLGNRYIACTENPMPVEFDPATLEMRGHLNLRASAREFHGSFAHPHFDFETGEMIGYVTRVGLRNTHRVIAVEPDTLRRREIGTVPAGVNPSYMHSFAMTEHYVVLVRQPLVYKLLPVLRTGKFQDAFRWHPERGTRYDVIDRRTGALRGSYRGDPLFYWHQINAFEDGDLIVLDLVAGDRPDSLWDLDLVKLRDPEHRPVFYGDLRRVRIPLSGGPVTDEVLADVRAEFPTINYRRNHMRDYRWTYAPAYAGPDSDWFDELIKVDVGTGEVARWREPGCYPSEPVIVPVPGREEEDAVLVLNIVLGSRAGRSFLLVLDGETFTELARAEVPHHIPFNFHQQFLTT